MEIITVLTARAERNANLSKRPPWARHTHDAVLTAVHHPQRAGHFAAYIHDDHGTLIGQSEGSMSQLVELLHQFMQAMQPASGPVVSGVVPINPPHPPGPTGGDHLARAQLASVHLAERARVAATP
jgi:hypothetical protein